MAARSSQTCPFLAKMRRCTWRVSATGQASSNLHKAPEVDSTSVANHVLSEAPNLLRGPGWIRAVLDDLSRHFRHEVMLDCPKPVFIEQPRSLRWQLFSSFIHCNDKAKFFVKDFDNWILILRQIRTSLQ